MDLRQIAVMLSVGGAALLSPLPTAADGPLTRFIPFRRVDADPGKSYILTEDEGPWLILVANFAGASAEKRAQELVLELRSREKLPAYIHKQVFDFTQSFDSDQYMTLRGNAARMKYANALKYDGVGVLVGNFRSVEDSDLQKCLERVRQLKPDCMVKSRDGGERDLFASVKDVKNRLSRGNAKGSGPMKSAFVTRNPLLPDEFFGVGGVDDFVARLNRGVEYSLLKNKEKFTVRVATFRGNTTINPREITEIESRDKVTDKLEIAADKSHRLTVALRERRVDAYEFHDRQESIVTVGSFDGKVLPDGSIEIPPQVFPEVMKVVEQYRAKMRPIPGRGVVGLQPGLLLGIPYDVEPKLIEVPRRSVGADYSRSRF